MTDKLGKAKEKTNKAHARLPRGFGDRGAGEIAATRRMLERIRAVYERYGFEAVETPAIEYTDALGKFLPDQDRPNEGVFSFQDDDEQWLSLRYDLTAPLARYVAEHFDALPKPYRSYRVGWVFRNEKPGPGRFRQFMQFDADTVGSASPAADAEMCMMAADAMEAIGLQSHYRIKVNNRKLLDGIMEVIGLDGQENAHRHLTALRALDKYDRLGKQGVLQLLTTGRWDESGDFTHGAGLNHLQADRLIWFLVLRSEPFGLSDSRFPDFNPRLRVMPPGGEPYETDILSALDHAYGANSLFHEGIEELRAMEDFLTSGGYSHRVQVDPSVVRGLEYYTGPVYEVDLTLEIRDRHGNRTRFGSVGGGGRYDGLVGRFRNEIVPATGFSIGISRLMAALTHLGNIDIAPDPGPVVVTVFDRERISDYQSMVVALRNNGIRAELYLGGGKLGAQIKYANVRRSPCVLIQGSDEKARGEIQIRDLIEGAKAAATISSRDEWRSGAGAQFAVHESRLVDAVREILDRHAIRWDRASS
jgi:histidyl-tRNA synthetase